MGFNIKKALEEQLPLLFESGKKNRTLAILGVTVLVQSILLLRVSLQIRAIYDILLLLTERLNLLV